MDFLTEDGSLSYQAEEALISFLENNLFLDSKTSSEYTGGLDGGPLYKDYTTITLRLGRTILGEVSF